MNSVKTLIIYDKSGAIIASFVADSVTPPVGVPYTIIDIPESKIVDSINPATGKPIWRDSQNSVSDIEILSARQDYICMMSGIDVSSLIDLQDDLEEDLTHSPNFMRVKKYYQNGLWKLIALKNAISRWITEAEYTELLALGGTESKSNSHEEEEAHEEGDLG